MYDFFFIFGPKTLPFVTNFCIGSGKKFCRMGREVKKNWFNLKLQGFQPSTPSREGFYSHHYDDAFDGGSSLSLDIRSESIRLFVCEFSCDEDIIFSYTFKRFDDANDVHVNLNILETRRSVDAQLVCDGTIGTNRLSTPCLEEDDVRSIAVFLANNRLSFVPSKINGWETRYFLLRFEKSMKAIITDIGVRKTKRGKVLLGQIAFYSAKDLNQDNLSHINMIQF